LIENSKNFEITCKKCGSKNVKIYGATLEGPFRCTYHARVSIHCENCGNDEISDNSDGCTPYVKE